MKANWGLVLLPPLVFCMLLLFGSQWVFLRSSFFEDLGIGRLGTEFQFNNYFTVFADPFFFDALTLNFKLAAGVVMATLIVAYPVAYVVARMRARWAMIFLAGIVVSSFVSIVIKILGIIILFAADGPLVKTLKALGIIGDRFAVIGSMQGVIIGLTHLAIAFMVMMLFSVIQTIPRSYEEAAEIHGAPRWRVFLRIIIPLSLPGVVSASLLLFNVVMGAFVSALLLGGGKIMTLPVVIQRTIMLYSEYGMAAALSAVLMLFVLTINILSVFLVTRLRAASSAVT